MQETLLAINGRTIAVLEQRNTGCPWLVCVHGLQSNKLVFADMFQRPFFSNYSLLSIDCIGFGNSEKPVDFSYDLQEQADICLAVLDALEIQTCHFIGHSMGGMIGTMLLQPLGERLASFVNMEGNLVLADCGKSADVAKMSLEEFEQSGYDALKAELASSSEPSAPHRKRYLESTPAYVFYKTSVSIVEWSRSEKLLSLFNNASQRRMFLYGSRNATKANSVGAGIVKAEIPEAGHFMMFDRPEETYRAIESFVA